MTYPELNEFNDYEIKHPKLLLSALIIGIVLEIFIFII